MPGKLLVVEDDLALLHGLRDILELSGYHVQTARNGQDALEVLRQGAQPDLILSDIDMPRLNGYGFLEQLRANPEWVQIPFIFLSAKGERTDVRRGKALGADDYLTKPFETEDLLVTIASRIQRRAQLEAAQDRQLASLKHTILNTLSHEFRTPLTYITTHAELVKDKDLSSEEFKEFMHSVRAGSARLQRLVEDFMLLVALQSGEAQQTFDRRRERLGVLPLLLQKALADMGPQATARQVQIVETFPGTLPPVWADREYLLDAVKRLLDNAIKFSHPTLGVVQIGAQAAATQVLIQIQDNGPGIQEAELQKIFDLFTQIDRAKTEQQGTGSGLAIASGIVRLHGGTLTAHSVVGQGTTFTLTLPLAP